MEFPCEPPCYRKFKSAAALAQHRSSAPRHLEDKLPANGGINGIGGIDGINGIDGIDGINGIDGTNGIDGIDGIDTATDLHGDYGVSIVHPTNGPNGITGAGSSETKAKGESQGKGKGNKKGKGKGVARVCTPCGRTFATKDALAAHIRDSPKHAADEAGQSGVRVTPMPAPAPPPAPAPAPEPTARPAPSSPAIGKRRKPVESPLDRFFRSFAAFTYVRFKSPADSFQQLARYFRWNPQSPARADAWAAYQQALIDEVRVWFGDEHDIHAWRELCRAVGIRDPPWSRPECAQMLRSTHVNIVDLIEWGRNGRPADSPITVYETIGELRQYTMQNAKVFPAREVQRDGETNIVLRHLLRDFGAPGRWRKRS